MQTKVELGRVFPNQTMIEVLLFFLFNPNEKAPLSRIVQGTKKALIQVQRTLKRLIEIGLVLKSTRTGKTYYQANYSHIAYEELQRLALKSKILSPIFKNELKYLESRVEYGFIYGSFAKGSHTVTSDLDIFLVGNLSYHDLGTFFYSLSRELVCEVNVALFSPKQLVEQAEDRDVFIENVLLGPKIWLFGNKNEFERLLKKGIPAHS